MAKKWSDSEIDYLIINYPVKGVKYCAAYLGRTVNAVRAKWYAIEKGFNDVEVLDLLAIDAPINVKLDFDSTSLFFITASYLNGFSPVKCDDARVNVQNVNKIRLTPITDQLGTYQIPVLLSGEDVTESFDIVLYTSINDDIKPTIHVQLV